MRKNLLRYAALVLCLIPALVSYAQTTTVKMTTQAPEGTELRIYSLPYNAASITGATNGQFFGTFISKGPGTEITIKGEVDELEVYGCQLSSITVESAPSMYILKCYNNQLQSIDVSNCPELAVLDCHNNQLSGINVTANNKLEQLIASGNNLTAVELGSLPLMQNLDLSSNQLVSLDLSKLTALEDLYVQNNHLTGLDLSNNKKLNWIYAFCNQIFGAEMDDFMAKLPEAVQSPSMLYMVDTFEDATVEGNICLVKNVQTARSKGWVVMDYAKGLENTGMLGQFYYGADYIPTVSENGVRFTTARQPGQTIKLYIKAAGDFAVEGVEETNFASGSNTLTLSSSEVFVKGDLTIFECPGNEITELTFAGTPSALTSFDCSENLIEKLEVVNAVAVTQIHAQKNALTSFNIEGCKNIMRVDCYENKLSGRAMRLFMESLPDGTANNPYLFVIDTESNKEENVATTVDVAIATGKKWDVFNYSGGINWGMGTSYEGSEPTEPELPAEYFTFSLTEVSEVLLNVVFSDESYYPVIENAELLGWNGTALTLRTTPGAVVKVYGDLVNFAANFAYIDSFDASACPNLLDLNLMLNELTTLDVSANTKLQTLTLVGNSLENLNVAGCKDLDFIICYGNRLKGDAMTSLMENLPMRSTSKPGQIIIYDGSYEREHNECMESDVAAATKRYWIVYELDADMNPIRYKGMTGIESVSVEDTPVEYFNLQGMRVENPSSGIFIRRSAEGTSKVLVK